VKASTGSSHAQVDSSSTDPHDLNFTILKAATARSTRHDTPVTMSKPTANWEKVGDKFYRKVQLYTAVFDQDLELENYNLAGAPYSGAVGGYAVMSYCLACRADKGSYLPR
jgi:hypothetical protein